MTTRIHIAKVEDLDNAIKEVEKYCHRQVEMAKELAKGKTVVVGPSLKKDLVRDKTGIIVAELPLRDVLLFSGQARPATKREISELSQR